MTKATILIADNDPEFLSERKDFFEEQGYKVISASDPAEAQKILESGNVALAILDMRLRNNQDLQDYSGLEVATQTKSHIPKIILTDYPTIEQARAALRPQLNNSPLVVDYLAKGEGPQALLTAVRKALEPISRYLEVSDNLANKLTQDYVDTRKEAKWYFRSSFGVALVGIGIIYLGALLAIAGKVENGGLVIIAGVIAEIASALLFKRTDAANARIDNIHREFVSLKWLDGLLAVCDEMSKDENKDVGRITVIEAATANLLLNSKGVPKPLSTNRCPPKATV